MFIQFLDIFSILSSLIDVIDFKTVLNICEYVHIQYKSVTQDNKNEQTDHHYQHHPRTVIPVTRKSKRLINVLYVFRSTDGPIK